MSFPFLALARPLGAEDRRRISSAVQSLLTFQRTLQGFPALPAAPDGTPFVSLYAGGALRGCFGSGEGPPGERLARAFLRALEDTRFGGVRAHERGALTAQVSYPRDPRPVAFEQAAAQIEPGTHGAALQLPRASPVLLLPQAARDERLRQRRSIS